MRARWREYPLILAAKSGMNEIVDRLLKRRVRNGGAEQPRIHRTYDRLSRRARRYRQGALACRGRFERSGTRNAKLQPTSRSRRTSGNCAVVEIAMIGISDIGSAAEKEDSHPMSLTVVTAVYAVAIGAIWTSISCCAGVLKRGAGRRKRPRPKPGFLEPASLHRKSTRRNV